MKRNVGGIDRAIRVVAGVAILYLYFVLPAEQRGWALIGAVPLVTGLIGWCPAYLPLGFNTCKTR